MRKIVLSFALWTTWGAVASGQMAMPGRARIPDGDLHKYNRVIAFGSVLLARAGSDVAQWKEVSVLSDCQNTDVPSAPEVQPKRAATCDEKLMVTTLYRFFECDNGRAFLLRSGEGILVRSRQEGASFGWREDASCGDDGPLVAPVDTLDRHRPLDLARLHFDAR